MHSDQQEWYLIYTKPNQERVALDHLSRQYLRVYLPMTVNHRWRAGKYSLVREPLFPRYLFIARNGESARWGSVRSTRGVKQLVCFGTEPARVPDSLIQRLREEELSSKDNVAVQPFPEFKYGEPVRVISGIFSGYQGKFGHRGYKDRVHILLEIAEGYTAVQLSGNSIVGS